MEDKLPTLQVSPRKIYHLFGKEEAPFHPLLSQTAVKPLDDGSVRVMIGPNWITAWITTLLVPIHLFTWGVAETFSELWKVWAAKNYIYVDIPEDDEIYDAVCDLWGAALTHHQIYLR